jgi:hypothetical protein
MLCGRQTMQKCAYCAEPICQQCALVRKGKRYCREQHADMDHPLGRLFRRVGGRTVNIM